MKGFATLVIALSYLWAIVGLAWLINKVRGK